MMLRIALPLLLALGGLTMSCAQDRFDPEAVTSSKAVFYGCAIDQHGAPVPDAVVQVQVRRGGFWTGHRQEIVEITTDAEGRFTYIGDRANQLRLVAAKEGYQDARFTAILSPLESPPERYIPDRQHPHPLVLWKMGAPQPVIRYEMEYRIHYQKNTVLRFNAETGRWVGERDPAHLSMKLKFPMEDVTAWLRIPREGHLGPDMQWEMVMTPIRGKMCYYGMNGIGLSEPYRRLGVLTSMLTVERAKAVSYRDGSQMYWSTMFSADDKRLYGRITFHFDWGIAPRKEADWQRREPWLTILVRGSVNAHGSPDLTPDPQQTTLREGSVTYDYDPERGYYEVPAAANKP